VLALVTPLVPASIEAPAILLVALVVVGVRQGRRRVPDRIGR
jgi:hypothetical protein